MIKDLLKLENTRVRILVTSRRQTKDDFAKDFDATLIHGIEIEKAAIDHDISIYIAERLHNDPDLSRWPEQVQRQMTTVISQKSDGMYVSVHLLLLLPIFV